MIRIDYLGTCDIGKNLKYKYDMYRTQKIVLLFSNIYPFIQNMAESGPSQHQGRPTGIGILVAILNGLDWILHSVR